MKKIFLTNFVFCLCLFPTFSNAEDTIKRVQSMIFDKGSPQKIYLKAQPAPAIKASLMEQAIDTLRANRLNQVQLASAGHRFFLYGTINSPLDVELAYELVRPILPTVENRLPIPIRVDPTLTLKVYILELTRRAHEELGLSWPAQSPLGRITTGGLGGIANKPNSF